MKRTFTKYPQDYVKSSKDIDLKPLAKSNGYSMYQPLSFNEIKTLANIGDIKAYWIAAQSEHYFHLFCKTAPLVVFISRDHKYIYHSQHEFYDENDRNLGPRAFEQFIQRNPAFQEALDNLDNSGYVYENDYDTDYATKDNSESNWESYFGEDSDESDEDKQLELLESLESSALEDAGIECLDASVQGRQGTIVFQKGQDTISLDYHDFTENELDIAYSCNSPEEYKEAFINYLNNLF